MTAGVAALGAETVTRIVKTIAVYDDFCHANDPHGEHDFGSFEADGQRIFFKIDYFDKGLIAHSPDPSDPSVTERVITCRPLPTCISKRSLFAAIGVASCSRVTRPSALPPFLPSCQSY